MVYLQRVSFLDNQNHTGAGRALLPIWTLFRCQSAQEIVRYPKAGDRRALEVWLTDAGWAAAEHVAVCGAEVDAVAHAGMTEDERETLSKLLARVIKNFEEAEGKSVHE